MKKIFLIPLMTLLCTVMAWGAEVGDFEGLKNALAGSDATITLTGDITIGGSTSTSIKREVTIDLNGHTLTDGTSFISVGKNGNVTVKNGKIRVTSKYSFSLGTNSPAALTFQNVKKVTDQDPNVGTAMYNDGTDVSKQPIHVNQNGGTLTLDSDCDLNICSTLTDAGTLTNNGTGTIYLKPKNTITDNSVKEYLESLPAGTKIVPSSIYASLYEDYASYFYPGVKEHMFLTLTGDGEGIETYQLKSTDIKPKFKLEKGEKTYYFKNMQAAMQYSTNDYPYKLQEDVSQVTLTYPGYLDLNGKTLTLTKNGKDIVKVNKGQLTIMNSHPATGGINITGTGEANQYAFGITPSSTSVANYSVLTIKEGVTINMPNHNGYVFGVYNGTQNGYGTVLNMNGTVSAPKGSCGIGLSGNIKDKDDANVPIFNIGGTINAKGIGIFASGYGKWNISDGASITGDYAAIEMRAGNLTIDGGSFTATATEFENEANSNGSTTSGAAITVAQHTTKLPINVTINGGEFRAIYPIAQANPQKNEEAYVNNVNITVNGGKFWATNTANVAAYTQDNKLTLKGGYYNLAPHAFVAEGYVAINNPDKDPLPSVEDGYLFKVVQLVPEDFESTLTEGNWVVEDTWKENESVADHIPTQHTNVTIPDGGNVYVQPTPEKAEVVAYAHNLTLEGDASLTVKDGATLVLGNEATVPNTAKLVVEEGGQLLIAPSDELVQPTGTVTLVADGAGVKAGKTDLTDAKNFYWQHFAIPTAEKPDAIQLFTSERTPINEAITYYNEWNITEGWEAIVKDNVTTPFVGYNFTNIRPFGANVNYDFTGKLVGNASNPLVFTQRGFNFLGNSYLAPINIQALQTSMYEQGLEFTIYIFTKQGKKQIYRAINEVTASIYGIDEIKPMQGFFMYAQEATTADFQYNSAVYSAFINKQNGGAANNAPARRAASQYDAKAIISIESATGAYDEVVLVESDKYSNDYDLKADARKMDNNGLNIYADGSFDNLAVMATNDLMGQTLSIATDADAQYTISFSNVEGELALRDNVTGAVVAIENGATYEFAAQPNTTLDARFQIVNRFNAPTAIENTEVKANVKGIYSITGMYLGEDFKALPAGVYVVDGVKIVK